VIEHVASDRDDRDADHNPQLVEDLLLAQKRNRPAYCLQHLDLELQSRDGGCRANPAGSALLPVPLVARFEPKWNSPENNKTRSFNLLGMIRDG
jgi:hypothetical protein